MSVDDATSPATDQPPFPGQRFPLPVDGGPSSVADLLRLLDLEELDRDLYRAQNPPQTFMPTLYGGQVAAQAARAAGLTVDDDRSLHSLHGYFLRPGRSDRPTILHVARDRDGRSFTARHVNAVQDGKVILSLLVSFHIAEPGRDFQQEAMPPAPDPTTVAEQPLGGHNTMFDLRPAVATDSPLGIPHRFWARTRGPLPEDRFLHECALVHLSDVGTGFGKLGPESFPGGASLDHALWIHRPVRMDEWVLVDLDPITGAGGRACYRGAIYDRAGNLVASLAQEQYAHMPKPPAR